MRPQSVLYAVDSIAMISVQARRSHYYNSDVTATRNKHVHFSARLREVAANHNAGIIMGVVDQLWRHCLRYFYVFRLINKGNFYLITSISYVM